MLRGMQRRRVRIILGLKVVETTSKHVYKVIHLRRRPIAGPCLSTQIVVERHRPGRQAVVVLQHTSGALGCRWFAPVVRELVERVGPPQSDGLLRRGRRGSGRDGRQIWSVLICAITLFDRSLLRVATCGNGLRRRGVVGGGMLVVAEQAEDACRKLK